MEDGKVGNNDFWTEERLEARKRLLDKMPKLPLTEDEIKLQITVDEKVKEEFPDQK